LALLGGLVIVDETAFLQVMISRPIVAGAIVGWVLGDISNGLFFGSIFELIYLDILPVGAVRFPDSGLATVVGAGVLIVSARLFPDQIIVLWFVATLMAIVAGWIGGWSITFLRKRNNILVDKVETRLEEGKLWAVDYHTVGILFSFLRGALLTFILTSIFLTLVSWSGELFRPNTMFPLTAGRNLIICISLALGIRLFVNNKTIVYFILGAGITLTFLGLSI
jgi:mannose/fructose/N-acetylgalactosamine-specific phosphotransferase system component IIC